MSYPYGLWKYDQESLYGLTWQFDFNGKHNYLATFTSLTNSFSNTFISYGPYPSTPFYQTPDLNRTTYIRSFFKQPTWNINPLSSPFPSSLFLIIKSSTSMCESTWILTSTYPSTFIEPKTPWKDQSEASLQTHLQTFPHLSNLYSNFTKMP